MKRVLLLLGLGLVACEDLATKDSGDTAGGGGCCFHSCDDGSEGWLIADSSWECEDIASGQCQANGLELTSWDYDDTCVDCDGCR